MCIRIIELHRNPKKTHTQIVEDLKPEDEIIISHSTVTVYDHAGGAPFGPFQYFAGTKGILVITPLRTFPRTLTPTSVCSLWKPDLTYPMAMFLASVGDGQPDVILPFTLSHTAWHK